MPASTEIATVLLASVDPPERHPSLGADAVETTFEASEGVREPV